MFAILLFMADVCVTVFVRGVLQHAVREGVRYAVTSQTMTGMGQDDSIKTVVQQQAMGLLAGDTGANEIHIRYYTPGSLTETTSNAGGNIVEVSVEDFSWFWNITLMRSPRTFVMLARASDRMEPSPGGIPPAR